MKRLVFSAPFIAVLAVACVLAWAAVLTAPDQDLHVTFIDVGEGDAILIRTGGFKVLVDGGPSPQAVTGYLGQALPFWDRYIDLVVSTHPHDDHLMGLIEVVRRYEVGGVLTTPYEYDTGVYREWRSGVKEKALPYVTARLGQEIRLGGEATLHVLHPGDGLLRGTGSDPNNNSVVLRLVSGSFSALLTGDIERDAENELLRAQPEIRSTVLKVPHQGARTSLGQQLLEGVQPRLAILSTGRDNPFGHPAPETLDRLKDTEVYRTDLDGNIEIDWDGQSYRVKAGRRTR